MHVIPIRTGKITPSAQTLHEIFDAHIPPLTEGSVVAVTSKIVAICEGRVTPTITTNKQDLINEEADFILQNAKPQKYNITLTVKNDTLIPTAGIDESNGNGWFVLWPRDPQKSANEIRAYLRKRFRVKDLGVIVTDSTTSPLRRGTSGIAIAHSGFLALNNYIGKQDVFGRELKVTQSNIANALAAAAVVVMGEGNEQTPIAILSELPFVSFTKGNPTKPELKELRISMKNDLYGPLLTAGDWKKGKKK